MVEDHTSGRKNYVCEINAVLTLDAVERLLFKGLPDKAEDQMGLPGLSSNIVSSAAIIR